MMLQPASLILRVTLLIGIVATVVFSGFGWFIGRSVESHFSLEDDSELDIIARTASQVLTDHGGVKSLETLAQRLDDILVGHHGAMLYIMSKNGQVYYASHSDPDLSRISQTDRKVKNSNAFYHWNDGKHSYRVLTRFLAYPTDTGNKIYTMSVAVAIDHHLRFLAEFRRTLWTMIGSAIVAMGLMGWFAVRQGHGPLHDLVARISHINAAELNTRLPTETVPRELTDLAVAFNEMLERMEKAFERLSNFSADIAHELRTPVTNLLTQTQVALSKSRNEDEYREILYSNIEEYERLAQMVGDMLFLAQADNGLYQSGTDNIDFSKEVHDLFEFYEAWAEERGVSLMVQGDASAVGDRAMLRRALSNLISNAIRYAPTGETVKVLLSNASKQSMTICVENPGPVIPAEHLPRLFDRFYRVDASRRRGSDGAGLGLAITKSIIDIHGGKIEVTSANGHTNFQITLPAAP